MVISVKPHIYSYNNGFYFVNSGDRLKFRHKFLTTKEIIDSKQKYNVYQHFNIDFPVEYLYKEWNDVPAPKFDEMLSYHFDGNENLIKWAYIFIGRMLHYNNTMDNWHIAPFFIHNQHPESKNAIIKAIHYLINMKNVLTIDNNTNDSKITDSFYSPCLISQNINNYFQISQSLLESIIYGSEMSLNTYWRTPVTFFGSVVPYQFSQKTLNMIIPIKINKVKLIKSKYIKQELEYILLKSNMVYLNCVKDNRAKSKFLNRLKLDTNIEFIQESGDFTKNSLYLFLKLHNIYDEKEYTYISDFNTNYRDFCKDNSFGIISNDNTLYSKIFHTYNVNFGSSLKIGIYIDKIKNMRYQVIYGIKI